MLIMRKFILTLLLLTQLPLSAQNEISPAPIDPEANGAVRQLYRYLRDEVRRGVNCRLEINKESGIYKK